MLLSAILLEIFVPFFQHAVYIPSTIPRTAINANFRWWFECN